MRFGSTGIGCLRSYEHSLTMNAFRSNAANPTRPASSSNSALRDSMRRSSATPYNHHVPTSASNPPLLNLSLVDLDAQHSTGESPQRLWVPPTRPVRTLKPPPTSSLQVNVISGPEEHQFACEKTYESFDLTARSVRPAVSSFKH
jgi:hypothetical protein